MPPGSAITASDSSAISALRSCIVSTMCSLVRPAWAISCFDEPGRDHADHGPAARQRRIGERPHQTDARAAIDDLQPTLSEQPAELGRRRRIRRQPTRARATEDENPLHARERSSLGSCPVVSPMSIGSASRSAPRQLGKRSIKTTAKQQGIRLAVSMLDLTTLEGADTPGKVRQLCAKAVCPAPTMPEIPSVAAICVYPSLVPSAKRGARRHRRQDGLGRDRLPGRPDLARGQAARHRGRGRGRRRRDRHGDRARGVPRRRRRPRPCDEIVAVKERCGAAHLKVILETGRARLLRPRPPRLDARDGGRRRLHQDLDRQGGRRRDARASAS